MRKDVFREDTLAPWLQGPAKTDQTAEALADLSHCWVHMQSCKNCFALA